MPEGSGMFAIIISGGSKFEQWSLWRRRCGFRLGTSTPSAVATTESYSGGGIVKAASLPGQDDHTIAEPESAFTKARRRGQSAGSAAAASTNALCRALFG